MGKPNILKIFSSVKVTIFLLVLLILASILGTLVPQGWTEMQYRHKYGNNYTLLKNLQLIDVFHSYWYTTLLILFCANLIICSVSNFESLMKSLKISDSVIREISSLKYYKKLPLENTKSKTEIIQGIRKTFASNLYRLKYADEPHSLYYFERGKIGRFGPLLTHASMIIILLGGIIVGRFGFIDHRDIVVGKTIDVPGSNFQIRADDFKVEFYPETGTPKDYKSILTIIENGNSVYTKTIEVNHPLKYKGVKFFQSSYGMADTIEVELSRKLSDQSNSEVLGKFRINSGEEIQIPNTQLRLKALSVIPDFVIDESGRIGTRSMSPNNPAAFLELYEANELRGSSWVFLKHPDFHVSSDSDYSFKFLSILYYTGLQISKDPGISIIWTGCLLMVIGMFLSFYVPYKRLWINLSEDTIEVGGRTYKDRAGFEKEFKRLEILLK